MLPLSRREMLTRSANGFGAAALAASLGSFGCNGGTSRKTSIENLAQLGAGFHKNGMLPPQNGVLSGKPDAKPLLSWRVVMLRRLGLDALFDAFNFDEPWDNPRNKALIPRMPDVFKSSIEAPAGQTYFKVFFSPIVSGQCRPLFTNPPLYHLANIPDGSANTIMTVESGESVIWTKPEDIPYDSNKPLPDLKLGNNSQINVLMAVGSVLTLDLTQLSDKTLRQAIEADDGQPFDPDWKAATQWVGGVKYP